MFGVGPHYVSTSNVVNSLATLFVELWKRRQSILVWEWDLEMDDQEEQPRPEFEVLISFVRLVEIRQNTCF